jgi:hypothetical protein
VVNDAQRAMTRAVAILAATITVFGAVVAALQVSASDGGSRASRDAQELGIARGSADVRSQSEYQYQLDVSSLAAEYDRRALLARQRARQAEDPTQRASFEAQAHVYADVSATVVHQSTVLEHSAASARAQDDLGAARAAALDRYQASLDATTDRLDLTRAAATEEADDAGKAGDAYVAIIALLAVALFLTGVSLTIAHRLRFWLLVPALALFVGAGVWTIALATRSRPVTPHAAIAALVDGDRKLALGDAALAERSFSRAIALRHDYAEAYARRAEARMELSTTRIGEPVTGTLMLRDRARARRAIADARTALGLGYSRSDVAVRLGYLLALVGGRYRDAAAVTATATRRNPSDPLGWLDLSVYDAALGESTQARSALRRGLRLAADARNATTAPALFAGTRTELERVTALGHARTRLVRDLERAVTLAAFSWRTHQQPPPTDPRRVHAVGPAIFSITAGRIQATRVISAPAGTPVVYLWYTRADAHQPWAEVRQQFGTASTVPATLGLPIHEGSVGQPDYDPGPCAGPHEFRLDVYASGDRVSSDVARDASGHPLRISDELSHAHVTRDSLLGLVACRPPHWKAASDPDAGAFVVTSPDRNVQLRMGSLPLLFANDQRDEANAAGLADIVQLQLDSKGTVTPQGAPQAVDFGGSNGLVAEYTIATPDGGLAASAGVSAGDDGVLRFFLVTGPEANRSTVEALGNSTRFVPGPPAESVFDAG